MSWISEYPCLVRPPRLIRISATLADFRLLEHMSSPALHIVTAHYVRLPYYVGQ